jgi:hypothetical protein
VLKDERILLFSMEGRQKNLPSREATGNFYLWSSGTGPFRELVLSGASRGSCGAIGGNPEQRSYDAAHARKAVSLMLAR